MNRNERILAAIAYLLSVVGALPLLLLGGERKFARFHALQSLGLFLVALVALLAWMVVGWVLSLVIPIVGPPLAAGLFALVITLYIVLIVTSLVGVAHALNGSRKPVPLFGIAIIRVYIRLTGQPSESSGAPQGKKPIDEAPQGTGPE